MQTRVTFAPLCLTIALLVFMFTACTNHYKYQHDIGESNLSGRSDSDLQAASEERAYGYTKKVKHHHANTEMHLSLDTGTKISDIQGVHVAHVIVTDANAYVAIVLNLSATGTLESGTPHDTIGGNGAGSPFDAPFTTPDEKNVSTKLKQKIALKVRELNPHVAEVFISANADFNTMFGHYLRLQWSGEDLDHYIDEFNGSVKRFFPETTS